MSSLNRKVNTLHTPPSLAWRKSSRSNGSGNCCQWAPLADGGVAFRDSKLGEESPVLTFTQAEWKAFIDGVKAGEADL